MFNGRNLRYYKKNLYEDIVIDSNVFFLFFGGAVFIGLVFLWQWHQASRKVVLFDEIDRQRIMLEERLEVVQKAHQSLINEKTYLEATIAQERKADEARQAVWTEAEKRFKDAFQSLSATALKNNNQSFIDLSKVVFEKMQVEAKGEIQGHKKDIETLVYPMQETLKQVDKKIQQVEKERVGAYQGLQQQIYQLLTAHQDLKSETTNLVHALKMPSVRGRWGEMQLRRVVEMAGMLSHVDFLEQVTTNKDEGVRLRPDMVVNLPGQKKIVVDSKAPLMGYLAALDAPDDVARKQEMQRHARHIRKHIQALSSRAYWDKFEDSPEFVVLFLPGETFFSAALQEDPSLIEVGVENKVILATPTTLIALLRSVSYGWRQESLAKNAQEISALGRELHKRLTDMSKHFSRIGKSLGQSVDAYNQTIGTYERRVLVSARKFNHLNVVQGDTAMDVPQIDQTLRSMPEEK